MHWAAKYIGKPWESGQNGPESYDCYGLVRAVLQNEFGIKMKAFPELDPKDIEQVGEALRNPVNLEGWKQVDLHDQRDGDVIIMSTASKPHHLGIWLNEDGGGILHCPNEFTGVVFHKMAVIRRACFGMVERWRHAGT